MARLVDIEGIGATYSAKLQECGINTQEQLLEQGATRAGRESIAEKSGISGTLILKWLNRADLARVKGIGEEYSDLLENAGVDTVPELAQRNAANLYAKIVEVNGEKKLVRSLPSENQVSDWIVQAKQLDRVLFY